MADNDDDSSSDCPLHKCVFSDDIRKLSQLLRTNDVAQKDKHGNSVKFIQNTRRNALKIVCSIHVVLWLSHCAYI